AVAFIVPAGLTPFAPLLLALSACGGGQPGGSTPIAIERRLEFTAGPPVTMRMLVQPEHAGNGERFATAAEAIVRTMVEAYGPFPASAITVVDPPLGGGPRNVGPNDIVLEHTSWWELPPAMNLELNVTRGIARRFWADAIGSGALPDWFVD